MRDSGGAGGAPADLAYLIEFGRVGGPAFAGAGAGVEEAGAAQHRHHQRQRHFGDRLAVGAGHVAHRGAVIAGGIERDGVHPDAEFLDQFELRRRSDEVGGDRGQHMEQRGDVGGDGVERFGLVDVGDDARTEDRVDGVAETGAGTRVEDDHATAPMLPAKAEKPANTASAPIASSMRSISFHFAMRSERVKLPTLSCPAFQPVARCAMVTSSLSPDRAETIAPQPRATAASSAAFASVTVPTWLTLISAALHTPASPARSTRSALVTSTSSPMIWTRTPIAAVTAAIAVQSSCPAGSSIDRIGYAPPP